MQEQDRHNPKEAQGTLHGSTRALSLPSQQPAASQPRRGVTCLPGDGSSPEPSIPTSLDQQDTPQHQSSTVHLTQVSANAQSELPEPLHDAAPEVAVPSQPAQQASSETMGSSEPRGSSTPSQDSGEENSSEEEAEVSQSRAGASYQAAKGRKAHAADAKQETRQSQRKPTPSRKQSAAAAAGRGGLSGCRRGGRGRASTPAARAAPKAQRTTSRKTAGKRRRSPS